MDIGTERKYLFDYDVSVIKKELSKVTVEDWQFDKMRQEVFKDGHGDTESIILFFAGGRRKVTTSPSFNKAVLDAGEQIRKYFGENARIITLMVVKLFAKAQIPAHTDGGTLTTIHRCHLPIITHKDCEFYINEKKFPFTKGKVFEINNVMSHSVVNNSDIDRIHLICDIKV
jgi:aspartyl/asparaginyl beta-hydroxylase (cupin superfamily)